MAYPEYDAALCLVNGVRTKEGMRIMTLNKRPVAVPMRVIRARGAWCCDGGSVELTRSPAHVFLSNGS